jgi:hypothetical protein
MGIIFEKIVYFLTVNGNQNVYHHQTLFQLATIRSKSLILDLLQISLATIAFRRSFVNENELFKKNQTDMIHHANLTLSTIISLIDQHRENQKFFASYKRVNEDNEIDFSFVQKLTLLLRHINFTSITQIFYDNDKNNQNLLITECSIMLSYLTKLLSIINFLLPVHPLIFRQHHLPELLRSVLSTFTLCNNVVSEREQEHGGDLSSFISEIVISCLHICTSLIELDHHHDECDDHESLTELPFYRIDFIDELNRILDIYETRDIFVVDAVLLFLQCFIDPNMGVTTTNTDYRKRRLLLFEKDYDQRLLSLMSYFGLYSPAIYQNIVQIASQLVELPSLADDVSTADHEYSYRIVKSRIGGILGLHLLLYDWLILITADNSSNHQNQVNHALSDVKTLGYIFRYLYNLLEGIECYFYCDLNQNQQNNSNIGKKTDIQRILHEQYLSISRQEEIAWNNSLPLLSCNKTSISSQGQCSFDRLTTPENLSKSTLDTILLDSFQPDLYSILYLDLLWKKKGMHRVDVNLLWQFVLLHGKEYSMQSIVVSEYYCRFVYLLLHHTQNYLKNHRSQWSSPSIFQVSLHSLILDVLQCGYLDVLFSQILDHHVPCPMHIARSDAILLFQNQTALRILQIILQTLDIILHQFYSYHETNNSRKVSQHYALVNHILHLNHHKMELFLMKFILGNSLITHPHIEDTSSYYPLNNNNNNQILNMTCDLFAILLSNHNMIIPSENKSIADDSYYEQLSSLLLSLLYDCYSFEQEEDIRIDENLVVKIQFLYTMIYYLPPTHHLIMRNDHQRQFPRVFCLILKKINLTKIGNALTYELHRRLVKMLLDSVIILLQGNTIHSILFIKEGMGKIVTSLLRIFAYFGILQISNYEFSIHMIELVLRIIGLLTPQHKLLLTEWNIVVDLIHVLYFFVPLTPLHHNQVDNTNESNLLLGLQQILEQQELPLHFSMYTYANWHYSNRVQHELKHWYTTSMYSNFINMLFSNCCISIRQLTLEIENRLLYQQCKEYKLVDYLTAILKLKSVCNRSNFNNSSNSNCDYYNFELTNITKQDIKDAINLLKFGSN